MGNRETMGIFSFNLGKRQRHQLPPVLFKLFLKGQPAIVQERNWKTYTLYRGSKNYYCQMTRWLLWKAQT